jgi:molybdate transport system substrate-binding protein
MWIGVLLTVVVLAFAGCGDDEPALTVSAAASLKTAFEQYGGARFSFAGSDELAAQIEQGVTPDVYAAADTALPQSLFEQGLVEEPVVFAANALVLAVPAGDAKVRALEDLAADGVTIAVGQPDVPVGAYTRTLLERLPAARRAAIVANVRSEEPDVAGITGKLTQGAVDAGFVYRSDVRATGGALEAIELPAELRPSVEYGVAVVEGAEHPEQAQAFVDGLLGGAGRQALEDAGFEPPPRP